MTLQGTNSSVTGAGIRFALGASDDLLIGKSGFVMSTDVVAVTATGSGQVLRIFGTVAGNTLALQIGDNASVDAFFNVLIGSQGSLIGGSGAAFELHASSSTIENRGEIYGASGIDIQATSAVPSLGTTVTNSGLIDVFGTGFKIRGDEDLTLTNSGTIRSGSGHAFDGGGNLGDMTILNSGLMDGNVLLAGGKDAYIASGNGRATGTVFGQAGNDTLTGGKFADDFEGAQGNDVLRGNGGNDILNGGNGKNKLFGGAGKDAFTFNFTASGEGKTRVMDFQDGADKLDFSAYHVTRAQVLAAASNVGTGLEIDMAALGSSGKVIIDNFHKSQLGGGDLIL